MAVANRSSVLILAAAALTAAIAAWLSGPREALRRGGRAIAAPTGWFGLAFLAFALLSIVWSHDRAAGLRAWGEFVLPLGSAFILCMSLPGHLRRRHVLALAIVLGATCLAILFELWTQLSLRRDLGLRADRFIFNRPALTLLVLAAPGVWLVTRAGHRAAALALAALVAATVLASDSGAATLALVVMLAVHGAARAMPRTALALAAAGWIGAFALAPVTGALMDRIMPGSVETSLSSTSPRARIAIWQSFGAAVREQPLLGAGFNAAATLDKAPVAERVPPERRPLLAVGHPHNAFLQVWTELGLVGVVLAALTGLAALRSLSGLRPADRAPILALAAGVVTVMLVGHGAWQGWWPAAIGAAAVWLRLGKETAQ
jgi:O-antigen ligase